MHSVGPNRNYIIELFDDIKMNIQFCLNILNQPKLVCWS